jgi:creatinine amidohydrolase/Fe(II)-dependent formamide hydrolase-like protein
MSRFSEEQWYTASAAEASKELGQQGVDMILKHMKRVLA